MKIVTKDNFCRDLFTEEIVVENVDEFIGKELVDAWNAEHWNNNSEHYLELVDDDYKPYDGYRNLV